MPGARGASAHQRRELFKATGFAVVSCRSLRKLKQPQGSPALGFGDARRGEGGTGFGCQASEGSEGSDCTCRGLEQTLPTLAQSCPPPAPHLQVSGFSRLSAEL